MRRNLPESMNWTMRLSTCFVATTNCRLPAAASSFMKTVGFFMTDIPACWRAANACSSDTEDAEGTWKLAQDQDWWSVPLVCKMISGKPTELRSVSARARRPSATATAFHRRRSRFWRSTGLSQGSGPRLRLVRSIRIASDSRDYAIWNLVRQSNLARRSRQETPLRLRFAGTGLAAGGRGDATRGCFEKKR